VRWLIWRLSSPQDRLASQEGSTRSSWSVEQAAWRFGVSVREYRELEAGVRSPSFETWDRICKLVGWPPTFVRHG